jgi:hypothetical protein
VHQSEVAVDALDSKRAQLSGVAGEQGELQESALVQLP